MFPGILSRQIRWDGFIVIDYITKFCCLVLCQSLIRYKWFILLIYKIILYAFYRKLVLDRQNLLIFYQSSFNYILCIQTIWCLCQDHILIYEWFLLVGVPLGNYLEIIGNFQNFGKFTQAKFSTHARLFYFFLFSFCTNYIRAKFHVPRTKF